MFTIKVPKTFFWDHIDRGCMEDPNKGYDEYIVKSTSKGIVVRLSEADVRELHSDAYHYQCIGVSELGWEFAGLVSSARATVNAIRKQVPELFA